MHTATLRRRCSTAGALVLLSASAGAAFAQDTPPSQQTAAQRLLSHVDFGLSAAGLLNSSTSGPITTNNTTLHDSPSNTVGGIAQLRYTRSPLVGVELNFVYSRSAQNFTGTSINPGSNGAPVLTPYVEDVQATVMETTFGYVVHTPRIFGFGTFVSGGGGTTDFRPYPGRWPVAAHQPGARDLLLQRGSGRSDRQVAVWPARRLPADLPQRAGLPRRPTSAITSTPIPSSQRSVFSYTSSALLRGIRVDTLLHRDGGDEIETGHGNGEREITLGTMTILLIFFALAVLCAVFFGFGYTMGRKSSVPAIPVSAAQTAPAQAFSGFKPAAGNTLKTPDADVPRPTPGPSVTVPYTPPAPATAGVNRSRVSAADGEVVGDPANPAEAAKPVGATAASSTPMPVSTASGTLVVQIAAVTHQEDADMVAAALKRRGYMVSVRKEPQDALLHVQVGPFATRKDADAMKQRLGSDGFNAIIKDTASH